MMRNYVAVPLERGSSAVASFVVDSSDVSGACSVLILVVGVRAVRMRCASSLIVRSRRDTA